MVLLAKGLASGFPIGALVTAEEYQFKKSEHGGTFGGGPLACAAALATIRVIERLLPGIPAKEERFRRGLSAHHPRVRGLMIGVSVGEQCSRVQKSCAEAGVLVNCAADGNLRLVPPLVITHTEIDRAVEVVHASLG
jgi:acetylornithine/N-succinyldiaminopimelate aminotransferase